MKKLVLLVVGILIIVSLYFVYTDLKKEEYDFDDNDLYAIKYLGYDIDIEDYSEHEFYSFEGDEYYLIIPRYDDMYLEIYLLDAVDGSSELKHTSENAGSFIVKGNISDIYSNFEIKLFSSDDKSSTFSPFISLKDGSLTASDEGLILK